MNIKVLSKNAIKFIIALSLVLICVGLNWAPIYSREYYCSENDLVYQFGVEDIDEYHSCELQEETRITVTELDAYILYELTEEYISCIEIELVNKSKKERDFQVYCDYGEGVENFQSYKVHISKGEKNVIIPIEPGKVRYLRFDNTMSYRLKLIKAYSSVLSRMNISKNNIKHILLGFGMAIILFVLFWFIDLKFELCDYLLSVISKYRMTIVIFISVFITQIICLLVKMYILAFVVAILAVIGLLIADRKRMVDNPEVIVGGIILVMGITIMLLKPFGHVCWDLDSHYMWALKDSYIGEKTKISSMDNMVLTNNSEFLIIPTDEETNNIKIEWANRNYEMINEYREYPFSVAHLPAGISIAVLRLLNVNYYWVFTLGCIGNLLLYVILVCSAISRLHSGKMLLSVIAIFPTTIFMVVNYTYDYWVISFSLLGMAYYVGNCQERDAYISVKDTIIMCFAFFIACIPKSIYVPLLLVPFLLPRKKIKKKKLYYTICVVSLLALCLVLKIAATQVISNGGDIRGGDVGTMSQMDYILSYPIEYANILIGFLSNYLSPLKMRGYITSYGYLQNGIGVIVFQIMLIVTTLTDKSDYDKRSFSIFSRIYVVLMYFGGAALIATAFFISFTPVGSEEILGCQARYIVPLLYPLVSILFGSGAIGIKNNSRLIYNYAVLIPCICVLFAGIYNNVLYCI